MVQERGNTGKNLINLSTMIGITIIILYVIYCATQGVFESKDAFSSYITKIGIWGPIIFIIFQTISVIIPISPGGMGCVVGVIAFGPVYGFIYNYIGIVIGSIVAFLLSKYYGIKLVRGIVKSKTFDKYIGWVDKGKKFERLFALAIFMPVAPDDFLCFLAGITSMTLRKFTAIIIFCKPLSIFLYSMGVANLVTIISSHI